jgi:hypothetical protein
MGLVEAKTATAVAYADGQTRSLDAGQVVDTDDLAEHVKEALEDGKSWTSQQFKKAGSRAKATVPAGSTDPAVLQMEGVEELSRVRAGLPEEDRHGTAAPASVQQPSATLPRNGADFVSDARFAEEGDAHFSDESADRTTVDPPSGDPAPSNPEAVTEVGDTEAVKEALKQADAQQAQQEKDAAAAAKKADK